MSEENYTRPIKLPNLSKLTTKELKNLAIVNKIVLNQFEMDRLLKIAATKR